MAYAGSRRINRTSASLLSKTTAELKELFSHPEKIEIGNEQRFAREKGDGSQWH